MMRTIQQLLTEEQESNGIAAHVPEAMKQLGFPLRSILTYQQQQLVQWVAAVMYSNQNRYEQDQHEQEQS